MNDKESASAKEEREQREKRIARNPIKFKLRAEKKDAR